MEKEINENMQQVTESILQPVSSFLLTFTGSMLVYIMDASKGKNVFRFTTYFGKHLQDRTLAKIVDMLLFSLIGGLIGYFVGEPEKPAQALMFGFGWTGLISSMRGEIKNEN